MSTKLCHLDDLNDPGSMGFELEPPVFIIKKNSQVYGYLNQCPHTGVNLEWLPNDFLNIDKSCIQCSLHGATFTIESGSCIQGPCNGTGLTPVRLSIDSDGYIKLE